MPRAWSSLWPVALVALAFAACSSSGGAGDPSAEGGGAPLDGGSAGDGAAARATAGDDAGGAAGAGGDGGYDETPGQCTPGQPRCHGDFGYQICQADGTWSESHNCAGYSANGTSSYCVDIAQDGGTWGTCVDPACWFWMTRGFLPGATPVGICLADGKLRRCNDGGTLKTEECTGVCTQVGSLDGRALGMCVAECLDGARECLGGSLYRACQGGRWATEAAACAGGESCNPLTEGLVPDIRCGGECEAGTSRCGADDLSVETCDPKHEWVLDRSCLLGRCLPAGPQAECQAECSAGEQQCGFDGATTERACSETGLWGAETACALGTSCRLSGTRSLGCVACAGSGNAFGVADGRCDGDALVLCSAANDWQVALACEVGSSCSQLDDAPSSVAACSAP